MTAIPMGPYRSFVVASPDSCADCGRVMRRGVWAWADTRRRNAPVCGRCASTDQAVVATAAVVDVDQLVADQPGLFDEAQP